MTEERYKEIRRGSIRERLAFVAKDSVLYGSAAALSASVAVSVAGQIAFVGLIVTHILRLTVRREHRSLLPLAIIGGALFLLSCDVVQRLLPDAWEMRTGVLVSLLSGPFFLFLLVRHKDRIQAW